MIKVARADVAGAEDRLDRERELLTMVGPPWVAEVIEWGRTDDGTAFVALEDLGTLSLAVQLARPDWSTAITAVAPIALAVIDAAAALHREGVVHRDIKPENAFVMAKPEGFRGALIDLGLADHRHRALPRLTRTGQLVGSPEYMAPEQCRADQQTSAASDVYALGVVVYELLTGRTPFWGSSAEVWQAQLTRRPPPLHEVSGALAEVVLRCLEKDPSSRYSSASSLAEAFRQALNSSVAPRRQQPASSEIHRGVALAFAADATTVELSELARSAGAVLATSTGAGHVVAFESDSEAVTRRACELGHHIVEELGSTAVVGVVDMKRRRKRDGTNRVLSAGFAPLLARCREPSTLGTYLTASAALALGRRVATDDELVLVPRRDSTTVLPALDTGCIGRESFLEELYSEALSALDAARPTLAAITGEAGVGVSSVARELARRLALDAHVITAVGDGAGMRSLLCSVLELAAPPQTGDLMAALRELLGDQTADEVWVAIAVALELSGRDVTIAKERVAAGALRTAVVRGLGDAIRARAARRPLILILDEAHRADPNVLDALEHATGMDDALPLWVGVFARRELAELRPNLGSRASASSNHQVMPLAAADARQLCAALLYPARDIPPATLQRLVDRAKGLPAVLVELARALHRRGAIRRHEKGAGWFLGLSDIEALPSSSVLEELAAREVDVLGEDVAVYAAICAAIHGPIRADLVRAISDRLVATDSGEAVDMDSRAALEQLTSSGLLQTTAEGYQFRHPLLAAAALRRIDVTRLLAVHRAAYDSIPDDPAHSAARAHHAAAAGLKREAAEHYAKVARAAIGRHQYDLAARSYRAALEQADDDDMRLEAHRGRGLMLYRVGRYEESLADLDAAVELAREHRRVELEAELLLDKATALDWLDEFVGSAEAAEQALALVPQPSNPALAARLAMARGRSAWRRNEFEAACPDLEAARRGAADAGIAAMETMTISSLMLATVLSQLGKMERARPIFDDLVASCERNGDRMHLCASLCNRRYVWIAAGDLDRISADADTASEIGRELGWLFFESMTRMNTAEVFMWAGDLVRARAQAERAIRIEQRISNRLRCQLMEPRILLYEDRIAECRTALHRLQEIDEAARERGQTDSGFSDEERNLVTMLELSTAEATTEQWEELCEATLRAAVDQEPLEVLEAFARWQLQTDDREGARRSLERALAHAATIPNVIEPRLRAALERLSA